MRANRGRDTRPELIVRKLVSGLGYRYRLHSNHLPGRPDIALSRRKKAIFVHGCFWHQHGNRNCPLQSRPKSNLDYWNAKLTRNQERDVTNQAALKEMGWKMLIVWECETREIPPLTRRIKAFLH